LSSGAPELREGHYDVFHVHFGTVATAPTLLRDRFAPETPVVTTFYGQDVTRFPRERGPDAYQRLFASADRFLALSASMRERLIHLGGPAERIAVHHLGVRCSAIPFHVRTPPPDAAIRIVCVARLVEKKGLADAICAIALLRERKLDVRFDIFGEGPERAHLAAEIAALHVADRVQLHGAVDPQRALDVIARGQLFLHPSVTARDGDEEGTPTVILEAMASGAPVVSTRHSGIPEQIDDGRTGLLAAEGDPVGLADRLETLVREPRRWADLARAARHRVERDFDVDRQNDLLLAEFERLLSHRRRGFRKHV
jgi:colanic acid/amylovoran biosynthesis glycosyltransferase